MSALSNNKICIIFSCNKFPYLKYYNVFPYLMCIYLFVLCGCSKHAVPVIDSLPVLRVEEWPLPGGSLTSDTVRLLIDRVCVFVSNAFVCCP